MNLNVEITKIQDAFTIPAGNLDALLDSFKNAIEECGTIRIYSEVQDSQGNKEVRDIKTLRTAQELQDCIDNEFRGL
jgi:hypothetical protein